ncbi:MAG: hypothetical protein GY801_18780 [bacterium]|nr:hypothetical protein [bacterium]
MPVEIYCKPEDEQYISSIGIEASFRLPQELHEKYGKVLITNIPHKIYQLFDKVGMVTILQVTDSLTKQWAD